MKLKHFIIALTIFSLCLLAIGFLLNKSNKASQKNYQNWKEIKTHYLNEINETVDQFQTITNSTGQKFKLLLADDSNQINKSKLLKSISEDKNQLKILISKLENTNPPKELVKFHKLVIKKWQISCEGIEYTINRKPEKLENLASSAYETHKLLLEEEIRLEKLHGANQFELSQLKQFLIKPNP